ncbi:hypothetical protein D3C86_1852380 [compost metagenome]
MPGSGVRPYGARSTIVSTVIDPFGIEEIIMIFSCCVRVRVLLVVAERSATYTVVISTGRDLAARAKRGV